MPKKRNEDPMFSVEVRKLDEMTSELPESISELRAQGVTRVITLQGKNCSVALVYRYGLNRYVRVYGSIGLFERWKKAKYPKE